MRAGRRLLPSAALLALAAFLALPPAPAAAQETAEVGRDWSLIPSGLEPGDKFRLIFVTSSGRKADSSDIGDYNTFVQGQARGGHSAIRAFGSQFRVVGSTSADDARDNTSTTYTSADKGVPIYWLGGNKVADQYEDFYDGSWSNEGSWKNQGGNSSVSWLPGGASERIVWTGSNQNGTKKSGNSFGSDDVEQGRLNDSSHTPLSGRTGRGANNNGPFYALSPVFTVKVTVDPTGVSIGSTPADSAAGYAAGETITARLTFSEKVDVTGTPFVYLNIGGVVRKAAYASGSGTASLDFTYTVQAADFDSNGVSLCSDEALDPGCGRVQLDGGSIRAALDEAVPSLALPAQDDQAEHKVDGTPVAFTPMPDVSLTPADRTMDEVPADWSLYPSGHARGKGFRLLFITTGKRDATSNHISTYNAFVQNALSVNLAIRNYRSGFRALASTAALDARDNTGTTGTGVPIYWLNGNRIADDYADFYDGAWDDETNRKNEHGRAEVDAKVWTGSGNDGTEAMSSGVSHALGSAEAAVSNLNGSGSTLWGESLRNDTHNLPFYGLSQVLMAPVPRVTAMRVASRPASDDTYRFGETVAVEATFGEKVTVRGTPRIALQVGGRAAAARYASGSGTATLRFEYALRAGDHDSDGFDIAMDADRAGPFRLDGSTIRAVSDNADADLARSTSLAGANRLVDARRLRAQSVSIVSSPASGDTYGVGETITVRLGFDEDVQVTGRPHVWLSVGGTPRRADYSGATGTATDGLDFSYTVASGDFDSAGVRICSRDAAGADCRRIHLNGGTIRAVTGGLDIDTGHPSQNAQSGHKVDGMPPASSPTACTTEIGVPHDWALKPSGVDAGGKFRLIIVTSTTRNATSSKIADYNSFVQGRAAAGHSAIQRYSGGFRVVASTEDVDARDNTCTTGTGVRIQWLNGSKAADNYGDFYDGDWDDESNPKNESGSASSATRVWTGSTDDGREDTFGEGGRFSRALGTTGTVRYGQLGGSADPLSFLSTGPSSSYPLYGLSQVFVVKAARTPPSASTISIVSTPAVGDTYRRGETILFEVTFSEAVTVRGTPQLAIGPKNRGDPYHGHIRPSYVYGSGTTKLVFGYTVRSGDSDDDGLDTVDAPVIRLEGAAIAAASDGAAANISGLAAYTRLEPRHKIDGALAPATGGVCGRNAAVRDWIVETVKVFAPTVSDCRGVTVQHLRLIDGAHTISGAVSLKAGDFEELTDLDGLTLSGGTLASLPAGAFEGLSRTELTSLTITGTRLAALSKDTFRGLRALTALDLSGNELAAGGLPDGVFETLTKLTSLDLSDNPGSATFRPSADAGTGRAMSTGETVTLGGDGTSAGPWGSNVQYEWVQTDAAGDAASVATLSASDVARPTMTAPAQAEEQSIRLVLTVKGRPFGTADFHSEPSTAEYTIRPLAVSAVAITSAPQASDTYRAGEAIEVSVTFSEAVEVDTSGGGLTIGLGMGTDTANRIANYVRQSGPARLVFSYTVAAADRDTDGVAVPADAIAFAGGNVTNRFGGAALLAHDAVAADTKHQVDGRDPALTGGVCDRTAQVRDALVAAAKASDPAVDDCMKVDATALAGIAGTLRLSGKNITALKAGDFAGLGGVMNIILNDNALTALPAGVFDGLGALKVLNLTYNDLGPGGLPDGVFEPLGNLVELHLENNPGSASFLPSADAGADRTVGAGEAVTLGGPGTAGGPWGGNLVYRWTEVDAGGNAAATPAVDLAELNGERTLEFDAPSLAGETVLRFRLTVTGRGAAGSGTVNRFAAEDTAAVTVGAAPAVTRLAIASLPQAGDTYRAGEAVEVAASFSAPVTVTGAPRVTLKVGAGSRTAAYLRGSGTRTLLFAWTVAAADMDPDGVEIEANALVHGAGTIANIHGGLALLAHDAVAADAKHKVNGSTAALTGGVCGRTAQVRDELVRLAQANDPAVTDCMKVDSAALAGITGVLRLSGKNIAALKAGDFAGLGGVTNIILNDNALTALPAGVFDGLGALKGLNLTYNDLGPGGLPDGVFEPLGNLVELHLENNPGSASFLPSADAGADRTAGAGEAVTLGGAGTGGGPWGTNVAHAWAQVDAEGNAVDPPTVELTGKDTAAASFSAPALVEETVLYFRLAVQGKGHSNTDAYTVKDTVKVTVAAAASVTRLAIASLPQAGDTYRAGEAVEVAASFSAPVTVTGAPRVTLKVGEGSRTAAYLRGSGTRTLLFAWTVAAADMDGDGVEIAANALALNGGTIANIHGGAAVLAHDAVMADAKHKVNGSTAALIGGVCGRTAQVRDELVRLAQANDPAVTDCMKVDSAALAGITGVLRLSGKNIAALKAGDFAGLGGVTNIILNDNALTALPAGVFDGLGALKGLNLTYNDLGPGGLPDGVFEPLGNLVELHLENNPGSASFLPSADAGADRTAGAGEAVTLGGAGTGGGPWGTNVAHAWTQIAADGNAVDPPAVALTDGGTAAASFSAPALVEETVLYFRLAVQGRGHNNTGAHTAEDTVAVTVRAGPAVTGVAFSSAAKIYLLGETIEATVRFGEKVTVTGAPVLALDIGGSAKEAAYARGSGTAALVFAWTVAAGDVDTDGIAVRANAVSTPGASDIRTAAGDLAVALGHKRVRPDRTRQVDGALPAPVSAEAGGALLTVTFGEALDETSVPAAPGGFTVALGATDSRTVTGVAVSGKTVVLTLARGIAADTADVTVSYTPPGTNPIRDLPGNAAVKFDDLPVTAVQVPNNAASGTVTVTGTVTVGQTLTAAVSNVADPDRLHAPPGYAYRWYRIDGGTETKIPGAESKTYTLAAADAGKRIRVKVTFDDFLDNPETLQSGPYPEFERVLWPDSACATPAAIADGTREQIWTAEVGVKPYGPEEARRSYGYGSDNAGSTLSDKTFPLGTGYTVKALAVGVQGSLGFSTTTDLPATAVTGLALHVCGDTFHFDDGPDADTNADATYSRSGFSYVWASSGLDWSGHATRRVWLSRADTTAPVLEKAVVNGATLTLTYGETLKVTSPAPAASSAVYKASVGGGGELAVSEVRAGVGPGGRDVTMTLSPAVEFGQSVVLSYLPNDATAASKVQDPAGNEAAGFLRTDALTPAVTTENRTPDAPRVVSVAFAGDAGPYGPGDAIEVEVTFNEAVRVTGTPEIGLEIGTATRKARWKAGQAAGTVQRFAYTVAAGDADDDGIAVVADSLALAGGMIVTVDDGETVLLGHVAQSDALRTVDTAAPAPLPTDAASASGAVLTVTFGEPLDETSVPAGAGGFTVQGGGNPAVTEVAVSGTGVTLSLSEAIPDGATGVTVSYKKPAANPIRDLAGNEAADFSGKAVAVQPDVTAPSLKAQPEGASVNGDRLTLVYDEPLQESSAPAPESFTLAVTRAGAAVSGYTASAVAVTGSTVVLTLSAAVRHGDIVTVSYGPPSANPIRDRAGTSNPAAAFSARAVENLTGVPTLELSEAAVTEGADRQVTLTLTSGGTAFAADRTFTVAAEAGATALETEDWTLSSASVTLKAGETEATAVVTVVDDARLEGEETVAFTATLEGVKSAARTLTVADNDRARLVVEVPEQATEGEAIALRLRLVPVSAPAGQPVADDACILDFPVDAVLTVSGDPETALPAGASTGTSHTFAASAFDDCTREIAVSVPTRAPDGTYTPPRALSFALAPAQGSDARILAGDPAPVTVRDDTIPPGPVVTAVAVTPEPAGATADNDGPTFRLSEIQALGTGNRAHGRGRLTFTLTFDQPVTVTGKPELVVELLNAERRAVFQTNSGTGTGSGTDTLIFVYTVQTGDVDPDGIEVKKLVVPAGAALKDMTADERPFVAESFPATAPKTRFPRHKVFGGLHGIRLVAGGRAREGDAYSFTLVRTGGFDEYAFALVTVTDSAFPDIPAGASVPIDGPMKDGPGARVLEFDPEREKKEVRRMAVTVTPPGDGARPAERTLTIVLQLADIELEDGRRVIYEPRGTLTATVRVLDSGAAAARAGAVTAVAGQPTVTEPGDDGVFAEGERIVAEVAFDAPVTVDVSQGRPALGLALGGVRREAAYESGSGTAVLSFVYTAAAADDGAGQARAISNGLVLNGATIWGEDGTDAVLEFGAAPGVASVRIVPPGSDGGSGAGTGGTAGDGAWDPGEALEVAFVFEEPVEVETSGGTPSVAVLLGAAEKRAAYVRGSGTDRLVFAYTLAEADGRATSALVPADTLALDGGAIRSTAGLDATLAHPGGGYAGALRGPRAALPVLSVADAAAAEGATLAFVVTLAPAASGEVTVDWATADGPSPGGTTAGSDYTAASGTLTFAAGETEKSVEVAATADDAAEAPETLTLTLSNPSGARLGDGEATGTVSEPGAAPLTGSFSGAPPEHDGTSAFVLTLAFSAEPAGLSYKTVRDALFTVTGAAVEQARRLEPPSNQRYELTLTPGGNAAVTLALAALPACGEAGSVCTADGRALAGPLALTVPGPAALSVADASVTEGPGAVLEFAVTLDRARHAAVTVDYATSDGRSPGGAVAGSDYTAASGTLTFAAGETGKTVPVAVLDDSHDEGSETMTLTLSNASGARITDGEATGTIDNSDAIPKAWIARFGRTVAEQVLDAVEGPDARRQPAGGGGDACRAGPAVVERSRIRAGRAGRFRRGRGREAGRGGAGGRGRASGGAARRVAGGRDRPGGGAAGVAGGDAARPADRLVLRAHHGDGEEAGVRLALGPGSGVALRRPRGGPHAGRRGGDRDAGGGLDPGPRTGVRGGTLERRPDRRPQPRRGRLFRIGVRRGRRVERQGDGDADGGLPLGAPRAFRPGRGLGRGGLRRRRAHGDAAEAGDARRKRGR